MVKEKKIKNPSLRIIKVTSYKDYNILIQMIVKASVFQCIIFKDGQFYQAHNVVKPPKGQKEHTQEDILKCGMLMLDTSFSIIDALEQTDEAKKARKGALN
jgi:hypothetical protein